MAAPGIDHEGRRHGLVVGDQATEPQVVAAVLDAIQARDAGEVDQHLDAGSDTAVELDEEIGAAGDGTGRRPMIGEEGERLLQRRGCLVPADALALPLQVVHGLVSPVLASRCRSARRRRRRRADLGRLARRTSCDDLDAPTPSGSLPVGRLVALVEAHRLASSSRAPHTSG